MINNFPHQFFFFFQFSSTFIMFESLIVFLYSIISLYNLSNNVKKKKKMLLKQLNSINNKQKPGKNN